MIHTYYRCSSITIA